MDQNNKDEQEWKKITGALFPPYQHPNPDLFVSKVMRRVKEESTAESPRWFRWSWRIPTLALGAIAGFFLMIVQPKTEPLTTESLLLGDGSAALTQTDELLDLASEEI